MAEPQSGAGRSRDQHEPGKDDDDTTPSGRQLSPAGAAAFADELLTKVKKWHASRAKPK